MNDENEKTEENEAKSEAEKLILQQSNDLYGDEFKNRTREKIILDLTQQGVSEDLAKQINVR